MLSKLLKFYRSRGGVLIFIIFMLNLSVGILCIIVSYTANSPELMIFGTFNILVAIQVLLSYFLLLRIRALGKLLKLVANKS